MIRILSAPLAIIRAIIVFMIVGLISFIIGANWNRG